MTYTMDDIKEGQSYWIKNNKGNIVSRKVLALNEPHKGMMRVEKSEAKGIIEVTITSFVSVMRRYGLEQSGGTGE